MGAVTPTDELPRRRRRLWPLIVAAGVVLVGITVVLVVVLTRPQGEQAAVRVKDGVPAPDARCTDKPGDLSHPWIRDGWWAGRVDGQIREMSSADAMVLSIEGHDVEGVWLCPPH